MKRLLTITLGFTLLVNFLAPLQPHARAAVTAYAASHDTTFTPGTVFEHHYGQGKSAAVHVPDRGWCNTYGYNAYLSQVPPLSYWNKNVSSLYLPGRNYCNSVQVYNAAGQTWACRWCAGQTITFLAPFNDNIRTVRFFRS